MLRWKLFVLLTLILCVQVSPFGVQPQQTSERISLVSEAVVLDVVVRDKRGRLVTDLTERDFVVFENGRKQTIKSFRLVDGGRARESSGTSGLTATTVAPPGRTLQSAQLISLLFGQLDSESRRYARQASEDLLKTRLPAQTYVGVFSIDKGLRAVSPYSTDFAKVREAVELATSGSFEEVRERSRQIRERLGQASNQPGSGVEADLGAALTRKILDESRSMETQLSGQESIESMETLVSGQKGVPGRKSLLYFSEGMYVPEVLVYRFRNLISQANLANVSIYSFDARGLTSQAQGSQGAGSLNRAAALSQRQVQGGFGGQATSQGAGVASAQSATRGSVPVGAAEMRSLETAENSIRMNVQETLDDLSASTGGFLTANTNDPGRTIEMLSGELQQYYEIVYIPDAADSSDEVYRKIRVEVGREDVIVQSRDGYYPSPFLADASIKGYEVPLLTSLNRPELSRDFPLRSRSFHFDSNDGKRRQVIVARVPFDSVEFEVDQEQGKYFWHFSILALITDDRDNVVTRLSQDYPIEGPLEELEEVKKGGIVFIRPFEVPPGRYKVEIAAYDQISKKTATRRQVLVSTDTRQGIAMSSLVQVGSLEPLSDLEKLLDSPLNHSGHRVIPNVGQPIEAQPGGEIGFYCLVYPDSVESAEADLVVAVFKDGEPLFKATPELVQRSRSGQLAAFFAIPADELSPGTYQLKAWAQQGESIVSESTIFTLADTN